MNQKIITTLRQEEPGEMLMAALVDLLQKDSYLLKVDANERAISHRIGIYLQCHFRIWDVDCEYNRDGVNPKKIGHLELYPDNEDTEARTVFPDIVLHKRGTNDNYLVIEIKKSTNSVDRSVDYKKLRGYKRDLGYKYAVFIELGVGDKLGVTIVDWI